MMEINLFLMHLKKEDVLYFLKSSLKKVIKKVIKVKNPFSFLNHFAKLKERAL